MSNFEKLLLFFLRCRVWMQCNTAFTFIVEKIPQVEAIALLTWQNFLSERQCDTFHPKDTDNKLTHYFTLLAFFILRNKVLSQASNPTSHPPSRLLIRDLDLVTWPCDVKAVSVRLLGILLTTYRVQQDWFPLEEAPCPLALPPTGDWSATLTMVRDLVTSQRYQCVSYLFNL